MSLIEQQQVGTCQKRTGELDAPLHAVRRVVGSAAHCTTQPDLPEDLLDRVCAGSRHAADERQILEQRQLAPETRMVTEKCHPTPHSGHPIGTERRTEYPHRPDGRAHQRRQDPEERRLARPVGTDDPDDLATLDGQIDGAQHGHPAESDADAGQLGQR